MNDGSTSQQKILSKTRLQANGNNGGKLERTTRGGDENANPNLRDVNVTVDGHGLDTMIPTIPRPNKEDIKASI